ncbi:uncharacterized protein [Tenebrio molitor]|uniref:uncharacterized protein n=1 Tax=Tenebrio molitor TaxID=7067 RepID=UPI003624A922
MLLLRLIPIGILLTASLAQQTKIVKKNVFLHRNKRYIAFPMNSNFVITLSLSKPLMEVQPKGFNVVLECDVPFALPSDTRLYKNLKNHLIQRREIFSSFETTFNKYGLNGNACVKRMICEVQDIDPSNKSLVKDILFTIFNVSDIDHLEYANPCSHLTFSECSIPFLKYIVGSLTDS